MAINQPNIITETEDKITLKKVLVQCYGILYNLIFSTILIIICNLILEQITFEMYIFFGAWVMIPIFLTTVILLSYFFVNKGVIIKRSEENFSFIRNGNSKFFTLDDIEYHQKIMTSPYAEARNTWLPWDDLHYSLIKLKSGEKLIISSILIKDLHIPIDLNRFKVKNVFFPIVFIG